MSEVDSKLGTIIVVHIDDESRIQFRFHPVARIDSGQLIFLGNIKVRLEGSKVTAF